MFRKGLSLVRLVLALLLAGGCLVLRPDAAPRPSLRGAMKRLPPTTLWVWERPEDLSRIDPATTAIAFLDQTVRIGGTISSIPRRQPMSYPASVVRIAVVRIEVEPGTDLEGEGGQAMAREAAGLVLDSAARPGIAALQIDFDATRSQRKFYAALLRDLRARMPVGLPLSITALASWCSADDWIGSLPVNEAVPMFFRMEPDRRRAPEDRPEFRIQEPLCSASVGVSTHERWPSDVAGKRIYIFADRGWRQDLALLADRRLP
jgi:hypothetical protein